ncbi:MAG: hypothetical protein NC933_04580, partial [Candidatus Omnitrophica bacterium]|nr:hypothetical protein [Candidatus Omnitrophota bacterium]
MKNKAMLAVFCIACFSMTASAHPPSAINTSYDAQKGELTVTVKHDTKDTAKHYVRKIEVAKDEGV